MLDSWSQLVFKPTLQIGGLPTKKPVTHTHHAVTEASVLACFGACESHRALLRHFQITSDSSSCLAQNLSQPELVILKHACSSTQSKLVRVAAVPFRVATHPLAEVNVLWFSVSTVQLGQLQQDQPATGGKRPNLSRKAALTQQKRIVVTAVYVIHTMWRTSKMRVSELPGGIGRACMTLLCCCERFFEALRVAEIWTTWMICTLVCTRT